MLTTRENIPKIRIRNKVIYLSRLSGMKFKRIAQKWDITPTRARQIYEAYKIKETYK